MMNKIHTKLISVVLTLVLSVVLLVSTSYAWLVLSNNPAAVGIQVSIGGSSTVMIAPDIQEVAEDGSVYHYPGHFSDEMNFSDETSYDYLKSLGNLNPVSTANGVEWILPAYYNGSDEEVQKGMIPSGALKDITKFSVDSELIHANLSADDKENIEKGHYVYMDFWVMSPAEGYKLRVSTGLDDPSAGSYVTELLELKETENGETQTEAKTGVASAVRVGFLANDLILTDDSMKKYVESPYFDERFSHLKGLYQEPNTGTAYIDANRFTIYEPNGDSHPSDLEADEQQLYLETKPLGIENNRIVEKIPELLTVQRSNGAFVSKRANLSDRLSLANVPLAGATDDVFMIELEKNAPQRIRMFLWLEGQDQDCIEQIAGSSFAVNIELACGNK